MYTCGEMPEISAQEIAEALVCVAKLIKLLDKIEWPDDAMFLREIEDELSELHQEAE
jgi:hypothetical protein